MVPYPIQELAAIFAKQSMDTWERLGYVMESFTKRGVLGPVRFGEETITDIMMMDLYLHGSTLALFEQTSKSDEATSGTDFELWLGSDQLGWFRFAIQAKKLNLRDGRYSTLTQHNSHGRQVDLLEQYAQYNNAAPLYCLYNFAEKANEREHWQCCNGCPELRELGCTVTPSLNIQWAACEQGAKNFHSIHIKKSTLPWRCLVGCPKIWNSLEAMSMVEHPVQSLETSPLFDPYFCYHPRLPRVLHREGGAVIRENRNKGALMSIRVDEDHEITDPMSRITAPAREEFRERYHREAGVPKAAAVMQVNDRAT